MTSRLSFASCLLVAACTTSGPGPDPQAACTGSDRFVLRGAGADLDITDFGFITSAGKIVGVNGSVGDGVVALNLRSSAHADLEADVDVGASNLKFFRVPLAGCDAAKCSGFFALAGSYHVIAVSPRYQATFELSDLRDHPTPTGDPGDPIAGTVEGCIDLAHP